MTQCKVPGVGHADECGSVPAINVSQNSGVINRCQTPLTSGQNLVVLASREHPVPEQEGPSGSLPCDLRVPDRG